MINEVISQKIAEAMKAKDEIRLSTLRLLASALNYEFITKQHKLSEDEELVVVRREAKKRNEAIEIYSKYKNEKTEKLKKREQEELAILKGFLPKDVSESELIDLVEEAIRETAAADIKDMGKAMAYVMAKVK